MVKRAKSILWMRSYSEQLNKSTYLENAKRETSKKCNVDLANETVLRYQLFDHEEPTSIISNRNITIYKYTRGYRDVPVNVPKQLQKCACRKTKVSRARAGPSDP